VPHHSWGRVARLSRQSVCCTAVRQGGSFPGAQVTDMPVLVSDVSPLHLPLTGLAAALLASVCQAMMVHVLTRSTLPYRHPQPSSAAHAFPLQ